MIYLVTVNKDIDKYICNDYLELPNYAKDRIYFDSIESLVAFVRFLKKIHVSDDIIELIVRSRKDSTDCTIPVDYSYYINMFVTAAVPSEFVLDAYDIQGSTVDESKESDPFFGYWLYRLEYAIYHGTYFSSTTPSILQDLYRTRMKDYIYHIVHWRLLKSE